VAVQLVDYRVTLISIGLVMTIIITILSIIYYHAFHLKHDASETGVYLRVHVELTHLGSIDGTSLYLQSAVF
jgi:hypothetical protein